MVALNTWWLSDPAQQYWMEITHRPDEEIGTNLWCPVRAVWSDALVSQVRPGDRILHWKTSRAGTTRGLIGWSEAVGPPRKRREDYWGDGTTIPCWRVLLGGLRRFEPEIASSALLPLLNELMDIRDQLQEQYDKPVYFPFFRYRRNELRCQQGYLVKFPVELFEVMSPASGVRHHDPQHPSCPPNPWFRRICRLGIGLIVKFIWWILGAAALVGLFFLVRAVVREDRKRREAYARYCAAIAARADQQHQWVMQGDDRGIYGPEGAELMHFIHPATDRTRAA